MVFTLKKHTEIFFLEHFWTLGRINNHTIGKANCFEKGPAVILNLKILQFYHFIVFGICIIRVGQLAASNTDVGRCY